MPSDFPPDPTTSLERWQRSGIARLTHRFGHRAVFVWIVAIAWLGQAAVIGLGETRYVELLFHTHLPLMLRLALWAVPAAVGLTVARTEIGWIAFPLLCLAPAQRLTSYVIGSGLAAQRDLNVMASEFLGRALVWALVIVVIWLISTWPDPPRITEDPDDSRGTWT